MNNDKIEITVKMNNKITATPGPWQKVAIKKWPFPLKIIAGDKVIIEVPRYAYGTGQKTIEDCREARGGQNWDRERISKIVKTQEKDIDLMAAATAMRDALIKAAEIFESYSRIHMLKKTESGDKKARRNEEYCQDCITVLENATGESWEELKSDG